MKRGWIKFVSQGTHNVHPPGFLPRRILASEIHEIIEDKHRPKLNQKTGKPVKPAEYETQTGLVKHVGSGAGADRASIYYVRGKPADWQRKIENALAGLDGDESGQ